MNKSRLLLVGSMITSLAVTSLFWIGYELIERSFKADEAGAVGYTTVFEIIGIIIAFVGIIVGSYIIHRSRVRI
jgi:hypothetical protein